MARSRTSGQGRPRGVPNRFNADIKAMILGARQDAGGQAYLQREAETNPNSILAKVLPLQVTGSGGGAVQIQVVTGVPRWEEERWG